MRGYQVTNWSASLPYVQREQLSRQLSVGTHLIMGTYMLYWLQHVVYCGSSPCSAGIWLWRGSMNWPIGCICLYPAASSIQRSICANSLAAVLLFFVLASF